MVAYIEKVIDDIIYYMQRTIHNVQIGYMDRVFIITFEYGNVKIQAYRVQGI